MNKERIADSTEYVELTIEKLRQMRVKNKESDEMENLMFTENMIAPCGLDCSICEHALKSKKPCPGCLSPGENKTDFCRDECPIIHCKKLKENKYRFCDECADFPCEACTERETRYMSKYPMRESPAANISDIRRLGMNEFLAIQRQKWSCAICSGVICVHTGICSGCGKEYHAEG